MTGTVSLALTVLPFNHIPATIRIAPMTIGTIPARVMAQPNPGISSNTELAIRLKMRTGNPMKMRAPAPIPTRMMPRRSSSATMSDGRSRILGRSMIGHSI